MPKKAKDTIGAVSYFLQVVEAPISYTDSQKQLVTIPNGSRIFSISFIATTGFNGTTPTYDVGYSADPDEILDGAELPATATTKSADAPATTAAKWANGITSGKLVGTFAGGGGNSAGAGKIRIAYYTP